MVFTQFRKVLDFRSGFIGLWLYVARPHFKWSELKLTKGQNFTFFDNIDLESPEIITAVV